MNALGHVYLTIGIYYHALLASRLGKEIPHRNVCITSTFLETMGIKINHQTLCFKLCFPVISISPFSGLNRVYIKISICFGSRFYRIWQSYLGQNYPTA